MFIIRKNLSLAKQGELQCRD